MRFLMRAASGAAITALCLGLLLWGATPYLGCAPALAGAFGARCALTPATDDKRRRGGGERVYAVRAEITRLGTEHPEITAFGEVRSGRTLEIRAPAPGRMTEVAPGFREGGRVVAGATLFRIDPADPRSRRAEAEALLAEARAEHAAAMRAAALAEQEYAAAVAQRDLRAHALERQRMLRQRGVAAESTIETAELALSDADRAALSADQARQAEIKRVEQADLAAGRAGIALADADRVLGDTVFTAPFDGLLQGVNATLGRLVTTNEQLGSLIDPSAIEVGFRVADADFARLLNQDGALEPLPVTAALTLGEREIRIAGRIDRVAATVALAEGGRLIYAKLDLPGESVLRPGDFVTVRIAEPALEQVARLPAAALDASGAVLVLGADGRLEARPVTLLRRQGDTVLARGDLDGAMVVLERTPQLGPGVKAKLSGPEGDAAPVGQAAAGIRAAPESGGGETIALDPDRRARLVAYVTNAGDMPDRRRQRLLAQLTAPETPLATVERLEKRMSGDGDRAPSN